MVETCLCPSLGVRCSDILWIVAREADNLTRHRTLPSLPPPQSDATPSLTVHRLGSPLLRHSASAPGLGDPQGSLWMWLPHP